MRARLTNIIFPRWYSFDGLRWKGHADGELAGQVTRADVYDRFLGRLDEVNDICAFLGTMLGAARAPDAGAPRVLDAGCGTGRLLPTLVGRGWRVDGLEPDADYRRAALAREPTVNIRHQHIEDLDVTAGFELIALVNGPLGYLTDPTRRGAALARIHEALSPDGCVVIDLPDFTWIRAHYTPPIRQVARFGEVVVTRAPRHGFDQPGVWLHTDVIERTGPGVAETWEEVVPLAIIDAGALTHELASAGFREIRRWARWTSTSPMETTFAPAVGPRLIVTARR